MTGRQGHNKGDKKSEGKFKSVALVIPKSPTPARKIKSVTSLDNQVKVTAKNKATVEAFDYSSWEPPVDIETIRENIWKKIGSNVKPNLSFSIFERNIAKFILPDLSEATEEQMDTMIARIRSFKDHELNRIAWLVEDEKEMRLIADRGEPGIADLTKARNYLRERLQEQNAGYTPGGFLQMRLEGVQSDLADPTISDVTVKVPSGYEINLTKPDARAILISMGIKPAPTKPYQPIWPKKSKSDK